MYIQLSQNVRVIHEMMLKAFDEYKYDAAPSSALEETTDMILNELENGATAFVGYYEGQPVASVRFIIKNGALYFYRLSVDPTHQGKGFAKEMLMAIEDYAHAQKIQEIQCNVRMNISRNMYLYESIGYTKFKEEIVMRVGDEKIKTASMSKKL